MIVETEQRKVLLAEQQIDRVKTVIEQNFLTVGSFYRARISRESTVEFHDEDIDKISMAIVLYYLFTYNGWRVQYKRPKYENLEFKNEDFDFAFTNDIIFRYCRKLYPADWDIRSGVLMGMDLGKLRWYYEEREKYNNM